MLAVLRRYLKLEPADLDNARPADWQLSVFRIMVLSGLLLVLAVIIHSSWIAWQLGAYHIIALTAGFYLALLALLRWSERSVRASAVGFLLLVFAAGACILLFNRDFSYGKLGIVFLYALPTIALFFLPLRWMFSLIGFNFIPFGFLLFNQPLPQLTDFSITLPATNAYLHGLIFLFFNLCMPLAAARIIRTLQRHSARWQQAHKELQQSHDFYEELFEHNGEATLLVASNGRVVKANTRARKLLCLEADSNPNLHQLLQPEQPGKEACFWLAQDLPCIARHQPQRHLQLKHMIKTRQQHHVLQLQDVTDLHQLQQALSERQQQEALWQHYDRLTCLPKGSYLRDQADAMLQRQPKAMYLCLIIRLCHIKTLNQQFGYEFGSQLLALFAQQFRQRLQPDALFGRVRGVKFGLLLAVDNQEATALLEAIRLQLPEQLQLGNQTVQLRYQIGYCLAEGQLAAEEMLERCEIALEQAHQPDAVVPFAPELAAELEQEYYLVNALQEAIRQRALELFLQPKVDGDCRIRGFEALCRWQHQGQWIAPDKFVALAQQHGFIKELSALVLEMAIAILDDWQQQQLDYPIAINLAGPELLDDQFFAGLLSQSAYYPWLTRLLQLELTETHFAVQQNALHVRLKALSQYGFSIAIDDFGTGHASLSQLVEMPADTLKIDRRFVAAIPHHKSQVKVLHTTLQLARALNLVTVAEGVETDIQRKFLARLGFPLLQGYLFGKPAPAASWLEPLRKQQALHSPLSPISVEGLYGPAATQARLAQTAPTP